jgi:hypothetical protein
MKNKLGNCFEVAGKAALEVVSAISYSGTPYVVHAEVTGKGDLAGVRFAHAWVEDDYFVYDFSNGNHIIMLKGTYYELGKIDEKDQNKFRKYTFSQARKKMLETGHYGSWDISTKLELGGYVNAIKKDEIFNEIIDFKKYIKEILVKRFGFVVVEEDENGNSFCQDSYKSHKIDFYINENIDEKINDNKKDQTQVIFISVSNEESSPQFVPKDDTIIHQQIFVAMGEKPVFNQIFMILETLIMSAKLEIEKKEALDSMQNLYRKGGNIGENSSSISLNIPLFLRLMELAKEDIKDDKELHFIAERLEQIKSKGTLTMDDYDFLAGIQNHPKLVRFEKKNKGGLISESNERHDIGFYQVTISHEEETEVLIETTDYNLAKQIYDDTKSHDKNVIYNSTKNLEICIRTFDFVGELDENETIDDYPIKDFYSDTDFYELADDGEWISLESEVIPSELNIEKETEGIEKDILIKNIVDFVKKMSVEYKYAGLGSQTFYSLIPHRNGYVIVRVADHFFNPDNIELGMEACWKGEKFGDIGEPEYRNVFGFLSISVLDKDYKKGSFEKEYERKNRFGNYNELVQSIKIENLDSDFQDQIIDALFYVKEAIDSAVEDGYFEEGKKYSGIELEQGGSVLLAPNGKPSNLTAEQWHLVRTPEFKAWFGDWENDPENASKVVDENGEPLVVYHGSEGFYDGKNIELENQEITEFSSERLIFTTENIDVAKYFGDFKEYFVNIKNPFVIKEGYNVWSRIDEITLIKTLGEKTFIDLVNWEWREEYKNFSEWQKQAEESEPALISIDSLSTYLKQRKIYDGVIAFDIEETTNNISANDYIAFYPTQIKLADGTNTTFSTENKDIRYGDGGEVEDLISKGIVELKMFDTTLEHAKEYGLNSKKPLYVQNLCVSENERLKGIGNKVMQYIDNYAIKNGHDVVFGHITQKARFSKDNRQTFFCDIDLIKHWLQSKGYAINSDNNDFHKIIQNNPDIRFEMGGILHGSPHSFPKEILAESPSGERVYLKGTNDSFPNVPSGYKIIQKFPFGRFRTENIGTGEGAQAFGWGLYFTDSEGIGRGYAKELAKNVEVEIDGKRVESPTLLGWISLLQEYYSGQKITKEDLSERAIERAYEVGYITKSDYDLISNAKDVNVRSIKNLYKVSLHKGKTPDQYTWLEWDKAINKDTFQKIYDGIQKLVNPPIIVDWKIIEKGKGKDAYYELADILGSEKRASLFLLKNGIDGIKYPAESKARGATSDTARAFNYVVFDENAVTIEEVEKFKHGGSVLLAPNGKQSNLTAEQWHLVRTPEFKAWFGDWENAPKSASKVVDENGEPLVLHRGNLVNQEELSYIFNLGHDFLKKGSGNTFGFFFTNNIDIAKKYMLVDHFDEIRGGSITSVFIKSNKTLNLLDFDLKIGQDNFIDGLIKKGVSFDNQYKYLERKIRDFDTDSYKGWGYNVFDYFDVFPDLRNLFIKDGFDSVIFYEMSRSYVEYQVYVAFKPTQVKLADGTNTTFNPNNLDIRFKHGGKIKPSKRRKRITKNRNNV